MIDQSHIDLPQIVKQHAQPKLRRVGGEWRGPCPFHQSTNPTTFSLWREADDQTWHWCCHVRCGGGDPIAFVMKYLGCDFLSARAWLKLDAGHQAARSATDQIRGAEAVAPPPLAWQEAAAAFVVRGEEVLAGAAGRPARDWLAASGFTTSTIQQARLGYNQDDAFVDRASWGLASAPSRSGRPSTLRLPKGLIIPWFVDGVLWKVVVRRIGPTLWQLAAGEHLPPPDPLSRAVWQAVRDQPEGISVPALAAQVRQPQDVVVRALDDLRSARQVVTCPRYRAIAGSGNALYNADAIQMDRPVILCEGALDVLAIQQEAGDLITAVASGTTGARRLHWALRLDQARPLVLSFDQDDGGDTPTHYWRDVFPDAFIWRAPIDDPATLLRLQMTGEMDLRLWIERGLQSAIQEIAGGRIPPSHVVVTGKTAAADQALVIAASPTSSTFDGQTEAVGKRRTTQGVTVLSPAVHDAVPPATRRLSAHRALALESLSTQQWLVVRTHTDQAGTINGERMIDGDVPFVSLRWWCETHWGIAFDAVVRDPRAMPSRLAGWVLGRGDEGWWVEHGVTGQRTSTYALVSAALAAAEAV